MIIVSNRAVVHVGPSDGRLRSMGSDISEHSNRNEAVWRSSSSDVPIAVVATDDSSVGIVVRIRNLNSVKYCRLSFPENASRYRFFEDKVPVDGSRLTWGIHQGSSFGRLCFELHWCAAAFSFLAVEILFQREVH